MLARAPDEFLRHAALFRCLFALRHFVIVSFDAPRLLCCHAGADGAPFALYYARFSLLLRHGVLIYA